MSRVIVLHAPPDGHAAPDAARRLLERLPYARRRELEARDSHACKLSLAATLLMFDAVRRLGFETRTIDDLRYPQDRKPALAGGPFFSISHTMTRIACAVCADAELGLDHEECAVDADTGALRRWTAVEATLKAAGHGLRRAADVAIDPALRTARLAGDVFHLATLDFGRGFVACLATAAPPRSIEVRPVACIEYDPARSGRRVCP